ncbi:hypothetical protein [Dyadobacter sp. SG02]|uniref:hypothetical protein n=1 Tax=Dyadobacter sp. SG02 TaxID=1855291 RepID=UPI001C433F69|nr:hypothetical protein [Dyadobacter sp. SG02]
MEIRIGAYLKHILTGLKHLSKLYKSGTLEEKRQIIGSIFPENLTFDGMEHRTARLNEGIDLIYQITSKLRTQKKGTSAFKNDLSLRVLPTVQKSNLLLEDLRKLAALFEARVES